MTLARSPRAPALLALALALALAAAGSGCGQVQEEAAAGYEPAHLEEMPGEQAAHVLLTPEGARRTGLRASPVTVHRDGLSVPYEALLFDGAGQGFVYAEVERLTYARADVEVDRVDGDDVILAAGPPAGTTVVTVGATEVYGTETGIAGGH